MTPGALSTRMYSRMRLRMCPLACATACALLLATSCEKDEAPAPAEPAVPAPNPSPPAVPTPPPVEPEPGPTIALLSTKGNVQTLRNGTWDTASVGQLERDDAIRTDGQGSATVAIGGSQLVLEQDSQVTVQASSDKVADLQLEKGRVTADLVDEDVTLRIRAAGSDAVAEAKKGSFSVFNDGRGLVAVASRTGEVKLSSSGGDVVLAAGEQGQVVGPGQPEKKKLRKAILLSVVWPGKSRTRAQKTTIRGKSEVGSVVTVNGQVVPVSTDGEFSASVPLAKGRNPISVTARDLLGREKTRTKKIDRTSPAIDRTPPTVDADTDNLWK